MKSLLFSVSTVAISLFSIVISLPAYSMELQCNQIQGTWKRDAIQGYAPASTIQIENCKESPVEENTYHQEFDLNLHSTLRLNLHCVNTTNPNGDGQIDLNQSYTQYFQCQNLIIEPNMPSVLLITMTSPRNSTQTISILNHLFLNTLNMVR